MLLRDERRQRYAQLANYSGAVEPQHRPKDLTAERELVV